MAADGLPVTMLERIRRHRVLEADRQDAAAALGYRGFFGTRGQAAADEGLQGPTALLDPGCIRRSHGPREGRQESGESLLPPPCSAADLDWAGEALGFPLPAAVQQLYLEVGNGSFGPDNAFFGLERLVAEYQDLTDEPGGPCKASWPAVLLPIADLEPGLTCLDIQTGRILDWAPTDPDADAEEWDGTFSEAAPGLVQWLEAWLDRQ